MAEPGWELQKAIYSSLSADAGLTTLLGGPAIYDRAPANADFPYVTFSSANIADWSTQTDRGHEHEVRLDIWSRENGRGAALEIAAAIDAALSGAVLVLSGHDLINFTFEQSDIALDEDGDTFHAVLRYRAVTEQGA